MKIVFMGTPAAAAVSLERMITDGHEVLAVYTQPDRPSGRGNKINYSPVKEAAIKFELPVFQPTRIKTEMAADEFRTIAADVAVVVAYGRILPDAFLTAFPYGAINVHFSLLPKYRGAAPVNWAIVNGETETGVTTMQLDTGLDTGPTFLQTRTAIEPEENSIQLMLRLAVIGADTLSQTLSLLGGHEANAQDESKATYAPILKKEDGHIDWSQSASDIANRVRGFQPFPTTFTDYQGKRLTIRMARRSDRTELAAPGTIIESSRERLVVACGSGSTIEIIELQPEGKRRMSARDFINGMKPMAGSVLGEINGR